MQPRIVSINSNPTIPPNNGSQQNYILPNAQSHHHQMNFFLNDRCRQTIHSNPRINFQEEDPQLQSPNNANNDLPMAEIKRI